MYSKSIISLLLVFICISIPLASCKKKTTESASQGLTAKEILYTGREKIEYEGSTYVKKQNISAILFIGVDKSGTMETTSTLGSGQSDVVMLLINDYEDEVQTILQIDRNTMVDINLLGATGRDTGFVRTQQICLSHSYGTGGKDSCENTMRAVKRILGEDIPIQGYIALLYEAVPAVNDTVGGVQVTIQDDFSDIDPTLVQGETLLLNGEQALHYVRGRRNVGDGLNRSRMGRQREYIRAFTEKVKGVISQTLIDDIVAAAEPYMVTDMKLDQISAFAIKGSELADGGVVFPEGKSTISTYNNGNEYEEFYVDMDNVSDILIDLFYMKMS